MVSIQLPIKRLVRSFHYYASLLFVIYYFAVACAIACSAVFNLELGTSSFLELLEAGDLGPGPLRWLSIDGNLIIDAVDDGR